MDVPISQINTRLLSQLPSDTGLGLLFATGTVGQVIYASGGRPIQFTLRHGGYALRCKVAPSVELQFELKEGQHVRATGFLNFSSQSVQYHLLSRDLELLKEVLEPAEDKPAAEPGLPAERPSTPDWLSGIQKRAQAAPESLAPGNIPDWVKEMAPPEAIPPLVEGTNVLWGRQRAEAASQPPVEIKAPEPPRLDDDKDVLDYLLQALERSEQEDVELTAELLARFRSHPNSEANAVLPAPPEKEPIARPLPVTGPKPARRPAPAGSGSMDRGFVVLVFVLFILSAVAVALLLAA